MRQWIGLFSVLSAVACTRPEPLGGIAAAKVDWSTSRLVSRKKAADFRLQRARLPPSSPNRWRIETFAAVNATPALRTLNFAAPSEGDALFFATAASALAGATVGLDTASVASAPPDVERRNLFKLTGLDGTQPRVEWAAATAGVDRSSLALSADGLALYVQDRAGTIHCYRTDTVNPTGEACDGWADYSMGAASAGTAPWFDAESRNLFVGDADGYLHKLDSYSGQQLWKVRATQNAITSSPLVIGAFLYAGDSRGTYFRLSDVRLPLPELVERVSLCETVGLTCTSSWRIEGSAVIDVDCELVFVVGGGYLFQLSTGRELTQVLAARYLGSSDEVTAASPALDDANQQVYVTLGTKMLALPYPFEANLLQLVASSSELPRHTNERLATLGGPLLLDGIAYVGTVLGNVEEWEATPTRHRLLGKQEGYGGKTTTGGVVDYWNGTVGNLYVGFAGLLGGGLAQLSLAAKWGCGSDQVSCEGESGDAYCSACCLASDGCGAGAVCNAQGQCATRCAEAAASQPVCARIQERRQRLQCPAGQVVEAVEFASYGMARADRNVQACAGAMTIERCHAASSRAIVERACIGQSSCELKGASDVFGDPCPGTRKSLIVRLRCGLPRALGCSTQHIASQCVDGACGGECAPGYADCNNDAQLDGCESAASCGDCCGTRCGSGTSCRGGHCVAGAGMEACP